MDTSPRSAIPLSPRSPRTDVDRPVRPDRAEELLVFELPSTAESATQRRVPVPPYFTHSSVLKPADIDLFSPRPGFLGQAARNERRITDGVTNLTTNLAPAIKKSPPPLAGSSQRHAPVSQLASPPLPNSNDSFQVHFEPVPITPRITMTHATPDTNYSHSKYSTTSFAPPSRRILPFTSSERTPSDFGLRDEKAWKSPTIDDSEWGDRSVLVDFDKVELAASKFKGLFARLCFLFYPFYVLLHIPITLFLDYNHLYIISQLALSPALPTLLTPRALQVGKLDASTAWWIAIAIYALSTVIWLVGIVAVREFYGGYLKIWRFGLGKRQVDLKEVYSNTAAFDRACLRSFAHFSFLYRVRLSTLRKDASGRRHISEAFLESFSWYAQNWPTAILLLPRAGIGLVILLLFQSTVYGSPMNRVGERDSAYFAPNGTLSPFASAVILTQCCWAAYRISLVTISFLGYWTLRHRLDRTSSPTTRHASYSTRFSASREVLHISNDVDSEENAGPRSKYNTRQNQRLRTAIESCAKEGGGGTPLFGSSSEAVSEPPTPVIESPKQEVKPKRKSRKLKRSLRGIDWNAESPPPPPISPPPFTRSNLVAPSSPIDLSFLRFPPMPSKKHLFPVGRNEDGQSRFSSMTSFAPTNQDHDYDLETIHGASPRIPQIPIDPPTAPKADTSTESVVDPFLSPNPGGLRIATFSPSFSVRTLDNDKTPKVGSRPPHEFRSSLLLEVQKHHRADSIRSAKQADRLSIITDDLSLTRAPEIRPSTIEEDLSIIDGTPYVPPGRSSSLACGIQSHRQSLDGSWAGEEEDFISRYLNGGITESTDSVVNLGLGMRADRVVSGGTFGGTRRGSESVC